jgi:MoaA/NifB/PqqE/SkfB family radical SAM enzyme
MTLTGPDVRILQIHPTRLCNLRCLHCYSSSGPQERGELGAPLLLQAIRDAARLGYNVLSISGGEPLLYSPLPRLCRAAREQKMITTLVTNGTVTTQAKLDLLRGLVDMMAISVDGAPDQHNFIRGSQRAFQQMEERLELIREERIPFAFVYTLTRNNLADLEWVADFAVEQGASMLQVHPLEEFGRACSDLRGQALSGREIDTAWMMVEYLREIHRGKLMIHLDQLSRYHLPVTSSNLYEMVSPLVIEDDGTVVPLRYGFPRAFAFGSLHTSTLAEMAADWKRRRGAAFRDLYCETVRKVRRSDRMFVNLYELLSDGAGSFKGMEACAT